MVVVKVTQINTRSGVKTYICVESEVYFAHFEDHSDTRLVCLLL